MGKTDTQGSGVVIYVDFMGGLHGNFLAYAINSLDPKIRKFDIFDERGTSHKEYIRNIATPGHYMCHHIPPPNSTVISITADQSDCLLVNLLCYGRSSDGKFDLKNFNIGFRDQLLGTKFEETIDRIDQAYNTNIRETNDISRGILREYFKWNFKDYSKNNIIQMAKKQKYDFEVFEVNFKDLYNFDTFLTLIYNIVDYFSLDYRVDAEWLLRLWGKFVKKIEAINQTQTAYNVYHAVLQNQNCEINFNLLQESWLNARLEIVYNKEMPFDQEVYFKNTQEIIDYLNEI
jgi:hypothetical protein